VSGTFGIEKLESRHPVDVVDCGVEPLNRYLSRYALQNQKAGAAQTYLGVSSGQIVGYYTLVVGEIGYDAAAGRLKKGLARHPVPVMVLARLAVSVAHQGKQLGAGLLKNALLRTVQAADIAGIRACVVHAKDDQAKSFYERFDFTPSPTDRYHLWVLLKDVRAGLEK
jgi:GNAT superfamily N-acetyltransferase